MLPASVGGIFFLEIARICSLCLEFVFVKVDVTDYKSSTSGYSFFRKSKIENLLHLVKMVNHPHLHHY